MTVFEIAMACKMSCLTSFGFGVDSALEGVGGIGGCRRKRRGSGSDSKSKEREQRREEGG